MIIRKSNLSNEAYHNESPYTDYISSSYLKLYMRSPLAFRHALDNPTEQTDSMRLGSLFHSLMESASRKFDNGIDAQSRWLETVAVFEPPVNEKTGAFYGSVTKAYKEAYEAFITQNKDKLILSDAELDKVLRMFGSMLGRKGKTSEQVRKLLKWAKESEVSYFYENEDGIKLKIRPDMLTGTKLIDWKTTSGELDEESIAKAIIKYGYHISMAMYQYVLHEIHGKWFTPMLVFVQTKEPFDSVITDLSEWCYRYDEELDMASMGVGALEFNRLLDVHTKCVRENRWPGAEDAIPDEFKIMKPTVPVWYGMKILGGS